jgi:hypothetical protein
MKIQDSPQSHKNSCAWRNHRVPSNRLRDLCDFVVNRFSVLHASHDAKISVTAGYEPHCRHPPLPDFRRAAWAHRNRRLHLQADRRKDAGQAGTASARIRGAIAAFEKRSLIMFNLKILMSSVFATAIALSSGLALAATTPVPSSHAVNGSSHMQSAGNLAKQCSGLETAFDQAINGHENKKAFQDARALREEGGHMCAQGAHTAGIHYLKTALSEVGVMPRVY